MGGGEEPSANPSSKHQRSTDDGLEGSSKRRKHHHHHRKHRHRRHVSNDRDDVAYSEPSPSMVVIKRPDDDDEREEGEILEEEEEGEIKLEHDDLAISMEEDATAVKVHATESLKGTVADNGGPMKSSKYNDEAVADEDESLMVCLGEGEESNGRITDEEYGKQSWGKSTHRQSEKDPKRSDKGKKYKETDKDDARIEHSMKCKNKDLIADRVSEIDSENLASHKHSELDKNNSKSTKSARYQYGNTRRLSPSHSGHHDEVHYSERSRSADQREESNRQDMKNDSDLDVDANHSKTERYRSTWRANDEDSRERKRRTSKHQDEVDKRDRQRSLSRIHDDDGGERERRTGRSREYDRRDRKNRERSLSRVSEEGRRGRERSSSRVRDDDKRGKRDRERSTSRVRDEGRRERERSASIGKEDTRNDRHNRRDKCERDSYGRSPRDRDRMDSSRELRQERERSSSHSRHDRDDRRTSKGRQREKALDGSYTRDRDRDTHREHDSSRDRDSVDRGRRQDRDRELYRERDKFWHRDSRYLRYDDVDSCKDRERAGTKVTARELNLTGHDSEDLKGKAVREEDEEDYQEKIEQQLAKEDEEDIDKIKEESRKRRQAIIEKYKQLRSEKQGPTNGHDNDGKEHIDVGKTESMKEGVAGGQIITIKPESGSDPSDEYVADTSFVLGKSPVQNGAGAPEKAAGASGLGEGTPKSEVSADMFCDDIFGESPTAVRKPGKGDGLQIERSGLHDNWDDAEGYYSYRFGEVLDGRYEVIAAHGKGVFSTVVRAKDLKAGKGDPEEVAIKIIRNNETMYRAGMEELVILKKLAGTDPEDRRHCVRFISSFKYRNHLCLVFESLHMNLREVLKKFGRNIGLKLTAVRAYAKQLFIALKHLRNCGVLHCDIKPDNMLVNEAKNVLKLCDFGNAMFAGKNEITPYLVSRFYRAPEIILGLPYDHPLDMWSIGCCLYELYTGKVLFPGPSNNDMLRLFMELKGPFPKKMLRKGAFVEQHFDHDLNFHATEEDPVTKKTVKRLLLNIKPKDFSTLISGSVGEDPKMVANFKDLLDKIFMLDPEKRLTVSQALSHPFITGK